MTDATNNSATEAARRALDDDPRPASEGSRWVGRGARAYKRGNAKASSVLPGLDDEIAAAADQRVGAGVGYRL